MARLQSISSVRLHGDACGVEKKIGHNTWVSRTPKGWILTYHRTDVVQYREDADGTRALTVNTGGWRTKTTLERIRHALHEVGLCVICEDLFGSREWRVATYDGAYAFTINGRGLMLHQEGDGIWKRVA